MVVLSLSGQMIWCLCADRRLVLLQNTHERTVFCLVAYIPEGHVADKRAIPGQISAKKLPIVIAGKTLCFANS
eukprot:COSAG06_NODE_3925_length_4760_cov_17.392620_1_plen_73_part_00